MRPEVGPPGVVDVLERGITDGTHIGAQLYISHGGAVVADLALGRAAMT
jgi:hypothetical protein